MQVNSNFTFSNYTYFFFSATENWTFESHVFCRVHKLLILTSSKYKQNAFVPIRFTYISCVVYVHVNVFEQHMFKLLKNIVAKGAVTPRRSS